MKETVTGILLLISTITIAQENYQKQNNNYFKLEFQGGLGFGFENVDAFVDENNETSTISGGGGWNLNLAGRYVFNKKFELGSSFGYHSSSLRPRLSNVSTTFSRISILPTFKYLITLNKNHDHGINIGAGYGFYLNGKMKFDATDIGLQEGQLKYKNASGVHFITEYEANGNNKIGYIVGLKYYNVNYDNRQQVGVDFDELTGSGIDLYLGITYKL